MLVIECFGGILKADLTAVAPSFITGDFDKNGKIDLLIPVRLATKVQRWNRTKTKFTYQEVIHAASPEESAIDLRISDLALVEEWPLLAVIHNIDGPKNRCLTKMNPLVLLFAMDKGANKLVLYAGKRLPEGSIGDPSEDVPAPVLTGEAVLLLDSNGDGSAIYWDGRRYRWYPVNEYQPSKTEVHNLPRMPRVKIQF